MENSDGFGRCVFWFFGFLVGKGVWVFMDFLCHRSWANHFDVLNASCDLDQPYGEIAAYDREMETRLLSNRSKCSAARDDRDSKSWFHREFGTAFQAHVEAVDWCSWWYSYCRVLAVVGCIHECYVWLLEPQKGDLDSPVDVEIAQNVPFPCVIGLPMSFLLRLN